MREFKNTILYLIGFAGVGKRTIANEIAARTNFRVIDNHLINNVIFPFVHTGNQEPLPPEVWTPIHAIRTIALDAMLELGNRDFSYIFTNNLYHDDATDLGIYTQLEAAAARMNAHFVPIRLLCEAHEHKKRIVTDERAALYKDTRITSVDDAAHEMPLLPRNPKAFSLDVTRLSPAQAAEEILTHIR